MNRDNAMEDARRDLYAPASSHSLWAGTCGRGLAVLLLALLLGVASASAALAQGETYALPFWSIDSGGGQSAGGDYVLQGEAGQAESQPAAAAGGDYILRGGIWHPGDVVVVEPPAEGLLWLPMVSNGTAP